MKTRFSGYLDLNKQRINLNNNKRLKKKVCEGHLVVGYLHIWHYLILSSIHLYINQSNIHTTIYLSRWDSYWTWTSQVVYLSIHLSYVYLSIHLSIYISRRDWNRPSQVVYLFLQSYYLSNYLTIHPLIPLSI